MALEAPLRSSIRSVTSPFTPLEDISVSSPDSPAVHSRYTASAPPSSLDGNSLRPNSFLRSQPAHLMSPISDIVGPSPVTSNETETTEIEDDIADGVAAQEKRESVQPQLMLLKTNIPDHVRKSLSDEAVSVIHAPQDFQDWASNDTKPSTMLSNPGPGADGSVNGIERQSSMGEVQMAKQLPARDPPPIATDVQPVRYGMDAAHTPQAQNLQDILSDPYRLRSSTANSLELIPESREHEADFDTSHDHESPEDERVSLAELGEAEVEVSALRGALEECWTLCNTLANLSAIHRERVFNTSGTPDAHEKAWKSCWKLCKRLYQSRDDTSESFNVRMNLDLCRDFCQALFDVRQRKNDAADSVLRVSFELNNHLYSAQDSRNLPEAFRERTLDFYITLCHRLMKQRSELAEETDSLLRACWTLAEMLFSLRQNRRDGKAADEELLGSAVQACWDLCDIFREGWTQVRPDRGTPRPSNLTFFAGGYNPTSEARSNAGSRSSFHSKRDSARMSETDRPRKQQPVVPETPVTEFEDTPISPESSSPQMPNIMVLGTTSDGRSQTGRWSSGASNLSSYSQGSAKTSSTATTTTATEDINLTRVKILILKAAMNIGFSRDMTSADGHGGVTLQSFVKSLPAGSFGSLPNHATLLQQYKSLVFSDPTFRSSATLPVKGKRTSAADVAKSVAWMTKRSAQYNFLRELYKLVFGFQVEDAETRKNVSIAV